MIIEEIQFQLPDVLCVNRVSNTFVIPLTTTQDNSDIKIEDNISMSFIENDYEPLLDYIDFWKTIHEQNTLFHER